jgi:hypothetical protein
MTKGKNRTQAGSCLLGIVCVPLCLGVLVVNILL